jgi:uncharacterized protein (TIGR00255 family)
MTLTSMTGFARADGRSGDLGWAWEARSVNGRGLDVRVRLAPGFEILEPAVREAVTRAFTRGSITVNLAVSQAAGQGRLRVNEQALEQVLAAADRLHHLTGCERPRAEGLLALKGVLEYADAESALTGREGEALRAAVLDSLAQALADLKNARASEGARLAAVLGDQLAEIGRLVEEVAASPARRPETVKARLREQIGRILESGQGFDEQRLAQEAMLIATRADVEEELKRLSAHIAAARELITSGAPVGRKLDFLAQEFNREANTLCSKSSDIAITRAGLALKSVIDQLREQVQNIE